MRLLVILLLMAVLLHAQIFEKIVTGSPVTDAGDSRAVTWIDYDNDGDLDLFVTNGPRLGENNFFYENLGNGDFLKRTDVVITKDKAPSDGATWGDYNNDGYPDLYVANWWGVKGLFYKNNGDKTFTQLTNAAPALDPSYSETASWGDYNRDGFLDLYVCNSAGTKKNNLYKNNGDGSFTKITSGTPVTDAKSSRNVDWVDYNADGFPDLFVANENGEHENLYKNNGDGTFTTASIPSLTNNFGNSASSNWEDIDNDGDLDVFIANYENQKNYLLVNDGINVFTKSTAFNNEISNSFCSTFGDIDNDGDLDLFVTNAFTGTDKTVNFLYINNGHGSYIRDTAEIVSKDLGWTYGAAFGDYDGDGDLDLFAARCFQATENNSLYKNNGNGNHWLQINLQGVKSNKSAIGAVVKVKALINGSPVWQQRRVTGQNGYCSQNLRLHFGLAASTVVDSIVIHWPSGIMQSQTALLVDTILTIKEDTTLTGTSQRKNIPDKSFQLQQNYPNPFNPETVINYTIPNESFVSLKVYNVTGKQVATLVQNLQKPGSYAVSFTAAGLASGVYIYTLRTQIGVLSNKMLLLK
ncbi:MAG: VCBS repeat-containing protein [Ignavibacteriales bacterium]|nr:VCBS repeat-containing protein [Ignavibacteriales bacterium]